MNRHELIMNTKSIPKRVNLENIEKIFAEYEEDIKRERESNFDIISPYEIGKASYTENEPEWPSHVVISTEVTNREFLAGDIEVDYPKSYFNKDGINVKKSYFGSNSEVKVGESQTDDEDSQPVAA